MSWVESNQLNAIQLRLVYNKDDRIWDRSLFAYIYGMKIGNGNVLEYLNGRGGQANYTSQVYLKIYTTIR